MDAPPIQYARTNDGLNIAYCEFGEGPLVVPIETPGQSHIALEWEVPAIRRFHEALAEEFLVARYNGRCSDRDWSDRPGWMMETSFPPGSF